MSRYTRFTAALLALGLCAAPVYAATTCLMPHAKPRLVPIEQPGRNAKNSDLLADCRETCAQRPGGELMLLAKDIPAPRHLPLVSSPDEVAAWHAEIFERLSEMRDDDLAVRYCQLML